MIPKSSTTTEMAAKKMDVDFWNAVFQWGSVGLIAVTFVFGAGALWTSNRINERQTAELLRLSRELSVQREATAKAELRLEELRKRQAPRRFRGDAILASLRAIEPKLNVSIWYQPENNEAYELSSQILLMLHASGWKTDFLPIPVPDFTEPLSPLGAPASLPGITILSPDGKDHSPSTMKLGDLFMNEFGQIRYGGSASLRDGSIRVIVGSKP